MMHDSEIDSGSNTRAQNDLLKGRSLAELSAKERLEFANLAPRPIPATEIGLPAELQFKLDLDKIASERPERRLQLANGAQRMNALREWFLRLHSEIKTAPPERARALAEQKEALGSEARQLFALLKPFQ